MPYVVRNAEGQISGVLRDPVRGAELLVSGAPELRTFWAEIDPGQAGRDSAFAGLDASFIRVLEDLVDVLIARHVITITDLPFEAQEKLCARKHLRDRLRPQALRLFGE